MTGYLALLRGINVGGHNKVPMQALRKLCETLGWQQVQSYIQSGNLIFNANTLPVAEIETQLETALASHFGLQIPVLVRQAQDWPAYLAGNPFPACAEQSPQHLLLALAKAPLRPETLAALQARAAHDEQVAQVGEALWLCFGSGSGRSKLTPTLLDRLAGSPVTTRNWRTVCKLAELSAHSA